MTLGCGTLLFASTLMSIGHARAALSWSAIAPLPDPTGFGGMYAGVSGGALMAAGGANFPNRPLSQGGERVWHDGIFVLTSRGGTWVDAGRLPHPSAYGASGTWRDWVVCAGGGDVRGNHPDAWMMRWNGHAADITTLPPLPVSAAYLAGVVAGDVFYVFGGQEAPDSDRALARAFALDLAASPSERHWRELKWPVGAAGRIIAVAGTAEGRVYLFSGVELVPGATGSPGREYLRDAYALEPGRGWSRLADLPQPVAAAPGPAMAVDRGRLAVLSGVNAPWGSPAGPGGSNGGFSRAAIAYDPVSDRWSPFSDGESEAGLPPARITAPLVPWSGGYAAIGGEIAPGIRTNSVLFLTVGPSK